MKLTNRLDTRFFHCKLPFFMDSSCLETENLVMDLLPQVYLGSKIGTNSHFPNSTTPGKQDYCSVKIGLSNPFVHSKFDKFI